MVAISDAERAKIEQEAKDILKNFSAALAKVKMPRQRTRSQGAGWREEGTDSVANKKFREAMFANAPHHNANSIIAEKKTWS